MANEHELMTDKELDALLAHASAPPLPMGARARLLAKLDGAVTEANVVPMRLPTPAGSRLGWLAGLPLAASLAIGIYLGSAGSMESLLPAAAIEALAGTSVDDAVSGIEDVEDFTEDDLS